MSKELELLQEVVKILEEREAQQCIGGKDIVDKVQLSQLQPSEVFKIGEHDFIVLKQYDGMTAVISKDLMAKNKKFDSDTRDYNKSSLKKLIEEEIQPIIESAVGAENIVEHIVHLISMDMQKEFEPVTCKVRPITFDEARNYNNLLVNNDLSDWWWTCTPWSIDERGWEYSVAVVSPSGDIDEYFYYYVFGVRPFCILKSNIFVSKGEQ